MNSIKKAAFSFLILLTFASCDRVPYDEVYENPLPVLPVDTSAGIDSNYLAVNSFAQKILIEDYTGHTCGNCPYAAKEALRLEGMYPGKVVVMAVHCSFFADPKTNPNGQFTMDFRTSSGTALDGKFNVSPAGLPKGLVNRRRFGNSTLSILSHTEWEAKLNTVLSEVSPGIGLTINPKYNAANNSVTVYTSVSAQKIYNGQLKMTAYLIEDSIVAWQKFYPTPNTTENIEKYVHRHVLRTELSPTKGSNFVSTASAITAGENFKSTWQALISASVKTEHAKVIMVVYRADTDEIVQVEEAELIKK